MVSGEGEAQVIKICPLLSFTLISVGAMRPLPTAMRVGLLGFGKNSEGRWTTRLAAGKKHLPFRDLAWVWRYSRACGSGFNRTL